MPDSQPPFRWSERRVARLTTLVVAGAVVLLDLVLFFVYFRTLAPVLQDLPLYRYMIPAGILAVLLFALMRFRAQLRLFKEDR